MSSEGLKWRCSRAKASGMSEESGKKMSRPMTREDRLAAKLRENLRRRKAQSRAQAAGKAGESGENGLPKPDEQS
jgi:hypothetical protein